MADNFKAHPWHGISPGKNCPDTVISFIEIVPSDSVKYEVDKVSGYRIIDRPQKFSNYIPALYGFIPRTYCGDKVGQYAAKQSGENVVAGDGDPLDICVITERQISAGDILVEAVPIGGFRMIDKGEADDKIIAVLKQDEIYGNIREITQLPEALVNRLKHYFLTYKSIPGANDNPVRIAQVYNGSEAKEVIRISLEDYKDKFE